jgi:hypothetical protein
MYVAGVLVTPGEKIPQIRIVKNTSVSKHKQFFPNLNNFILLNFRLILPSKMGKNIKQWPLAGEFVEFKYSPKIRQIFVTRSGEFGEY